MPNCLRSAYSVLASLSIALASCGAERGSTQGTAEGVPSEAIGTHAAENHPSKVSSTFDGEHECDRLAAHPDDPDRMAKGVAMTEIVPRRALVACESAVTEYPGEPRFHYQLGRSLAASGRHEEAVAACQRAADMGHRMALYNLGLAYSEGQGVTADHEQARTYLQLAATYSELDQLEEARAAAEVLRLSPNFSLESMRQRALQKDQAALERLLAALRKAGLK